MITLRNFSEEDAIVLQKKKYREKTIAEIQQKIQDMSTKVYNDKYFEMFAVMKEFGVVGILSLYEHTKSIVSTEIEIFEQERRKGYGTCALSSVLGVAKLKGYKIATAQIRVDNVASVALNEKVNFELDHEYVNTKGNQVYFMLRAL